MNRSDSSPGSLRRINLNLLYALDAILNASSLTEAGRQIRLSQPAMSVAFRKLRDQFNDELIVYPSGELMLTPLAEKLRPRVKKLLAQLDETFGLQLDFDPRTSRKTFHLSAPENLATMLLGRVVPTMLSEAQNIRVVVSSPGNTKQSELFEGGADLVIVPHSLLDPRFPATELMKDGLSCMVWDRHPTIQSTITLEQYLEARHASVSEAVYAAGPQNEILAQRNVVAMTGRYGTLPGLIIGTDLVATGSGWVLQYYASMFPVRVLKLPFPVELESVFAQWPDHRTNDPAHRWLMTHIDSFTATHRRAHKSTHKKT
ncbi:MAG: LysR family transcriptional regulator [Gluconobacter oxydans]|uniref:LysR family transcriptional regulator n=1 Tax=Gluconobacter oxydans TaxID=442 RepID=UPI0039E94E57